MVVEIIGNMYIQADDDLFYQDPVLHDDLFNWYIIPVKEDNFRFCTTVKFPMNIVKTIFKTYGIFFQKISDVERHLEPFPPDWLGTKACKTFEIEFIDRLPSSLIRKETKKINPALVPEFNSNFKRFQSKYSDEEIRNIYTGKVKCPLYARLTKQEMQYKIRKLLKIRKITDLKKGEYSLHR